MLYQQELINALVELIHKDHIDTAYKLSVLAWSPENQESVNIFIKQLIRVEKVLLFLWHCYFYTLKIKI